MTIFDWLAQLSVVERIFIFIGAFGIIASVILILIYIIRRINANTHGINFKGDKSKNDSEKKENQTDPTLCGSNANLNASQDYRIISLIVQSHAGRIREEMKQYCSVNGLDKKNKDEYMIYVDEKKNLYIAELKEMFNREYMTYDILTITDVYEIIEESKDEIMNKLEKLYIKVRDISIEEHTRLNEEKDNINKEINEKIMIWYETSYPTKKDRADSINEFIKNYRESYEKIIINERIDILNKQVQKIDMAKKDLIDIIMKKVIEKMSIKIKS